MSQSGLATRLAVLLSTLVTLGATGAVTAPQAAASSVAEAAADHAVAQVGKAYQYGATGPNAFDCSGLAQWSYKQAGKNLGRTTYDQFAQGKAVSQAEIAKGDLVFFYSGPTHMGIALGDGTMVHAPSSGKTIQVVNMADYWSAHFKGARRVA